MHNFLIQKLDKISTIASGSKFSRLINNPFNYLIAIGYREIIYPIIHKPLNKSVKLFWGDQMTVALPSGVDMYILGAKADNSEIRLAKYLINNLKNGSCFIDVGAHFGYYSKLAAHLVGRSGFVISLEPSSLAFELLKENTSQSSNIAIYNSLIGSSSAEILFYEFPTKYAEYNSIDILQYKNANWFKASLVTETKRSVSALDDLIKGNKNKIDFIKLDVEGAEHKVLIGAENLIKSDQPTISLEYVHTSRSNKAHRAAGDYLIKLGYQSYLILDSGDVEIVEDLDRSLDNRHLESDNFIFSQKRYGK